VEKGTWQSDGLEFSDFVISCELKYSENFNST